MRRVLFVGAPFGRFFAYLAPALESRGVSVWRTVCDGGEYVATPSRNRIVFRGADTESEWRTFLQGILRGRHISAIVTFNDACRRTRVAHDLAAEMGIARYVLEEGYLRPWWVTFDHVGVNGNSLLPKDPSFYLARGAPSAPTVQFSQSFKYLVRDTTLHFALCTALSPFLPYDPKYYGDSIWTQAKGYVGQYIWRMTHSEAGTLDLLRARRAEGRDVFVALLQKPGDAQLRYHSPFGANNPYMREVIESFAAHADSQSILVVKQHPLDYGIERSDRLFDELVERHRLGGRAFYVRTLTIESVLELVSGLVTINSTGGLAAIERLVPTVALGSAIYDVPGLTFQNGLDRFWAERTAPDDVLVRAFVNYLRNETQINGGYYSRESIDLLVGNLLSVMLRGVPAPHLAHARDETGRAAPAPGATIPALARV